MANLIVKINPENLIKWSNMEDWAENGTSAAPTDHTLSGASATVARESTIVKEGTYSAAVTRVGTDCNLYNDLSDYTSYLGRKMTFGCWVYATVASRARLSIDDAVGTTNSSYHTGDSTWQYLTVTRDIDTTATRIRCGREVNTGNTTAYFDGGILCEGDTASTVLSTYADIANLSPARRYRLEGFTTNRRDGKLINNLSFDDVNLSLEGLVVGASATASRTNLDAVMKALNPFRINPEQKTTKHDIYLYDDRYMRVLINSFDSEPSAAGRVIKFRAKMTAIQPFNKYINWTRSKTSLSASPTTVTVTTVGNMYTLPIISITAAGSNITSCTLENLTTGDSLSFTGTVLIGDELLIDTDMLTVTNDAVDSIASFTGDFMRLLPGDNQIKFTGTTGGTLRIDWQENFL